MQLTKVYFIDNYSKIILMFYFFKIKIKLICYIILKLMILSYLELLSLVLLNYVKIYTQKNHS